MHSTSTCAHTYQAVHQLHPPMGSGGLVATAEATAKAVTSITENIQRYRGNAPLYRPQLRLASFFGSSALWHRKLKSRPTLRSHGHCHGTLLEALGESRRRIPASCGGCGLI